MSKILFVFLFGAVVGWFVTYLGFMNDVSELRSEYNELKSTLDSLKSPLGTSSNDTEQDGMSARIDNVEIVQRNTMAKLLEIQSQLERMEDAGSTVSHEPEQNHDTGSSQDIETVNIESVSGATDTSDLLNARLAQVSEVYWAQEIDSQWAAETEDYAWRVLSKAQEESQNSGSLEHVQNFRASLSSFTCRETLCEATILAEDRRGLIQFQNVMMEKMGHLLPAIRFGSPDRVGNTLVLQAYLARTKDGLGFVN